MLQLLCYSPSCSLRKLKNESSLFLGEPGRSRLMTHARIHIYIYINYLVLHYSITITFLPFSYGNAEQELQRQSFVNPEIDTEIEKIIQNTKMKNLVD